MFVSWLEEHILYLIRSQMGKAGGGAIFITLKMAFFRIRSPRLKLLKNEELFKNILRLKLVKN